MIVVQLVRQIQNYWVSWNSSRSASIGDRLVLLGGVMELVRGMEQQRANAIAFQYLKPRERLLWAGREQLRGIEWLVLMLLLPPVLLLAWQLLVQNRHLSLVDMLVYFSPALLLWALFTRTSKRAVMALTDRRIMVIYPERSMHWFLNDDLKAVYPTIDSDGIGDINFLFKKPLQPESRILSSNRHIAPGMVAGVYHTEFSFTGIKHAWILQKLTLSKLQANDEVRPTIR